MVCWPMLSIFASGLRTGMSITALLLPETMKKLSAVTKRYTQNSVVTTPRPARARETS